MDNDCLTGKVYVVVSNANCLYEPDVDSAVRVIPPDGTEVDVVRTDGEWILIRFCGKEAWALRTYLSRELIPVREGDPMGPLAYLAHRISRDQPSSKNPRLNMAHAEVATCGQAPALGVNCNGPTPRNSCQSELSA